jgi:cell division protein FtsQ
VRVKAPADRHFKRAAAKPGRRRGRRPWLSWRALRVALAVVLVSYGVYRASMVVAGASVLRVKHLDVRGTARLAEGEIEQLAHALYGANILTADLERHRVAILRGTPWVADVAMRRVLPSTIEIHVSEREPFGLCRLGSRLYLIDREGTVIDEFGPQYADLDLPIVDGLVRAPRDGQPAIDQARAALAARVVDALREGGELSRRVSQIDVSDLHDAVVLLDDDTALLHLGDERFRERLETYSEIADALRQRVADIDYVDLRFEERMYVKPRSERNGRGPDRPTPTSGRY